MRRETSHPRSRLPVLPSYEAIAHTPASSFSARRFRLPHFPLNWHRHPEIELTLIVKGRGVRFIGDSVERYREGDLCLIGPNVPHTWQSTAGEGAVESMVVQFRGEFLSAVLDQWPEMRGVRRVIAESSRGVHFAGANVAGELLQNLLKVPTGSVGRLTILLDLLDRLSRLQNRRALSAQISNADNKPMDRLWRSVIQRLDLGESPTQDELAAEAGLTPSTFSRRFKQHVGRNFVDYVTAWRIARARQVLVETSSPITTIAFDAGFNNLSNFNRRFLTATGITPRAYRSLWRT